jgi:hypothetical protein
VAVALFFIFFFFFLVNIAAVLCWLLFLYACVCFAKIHSIFFFFFSPSFPIRHQPLTIRTPNRTFTALPQPERPRAAERLPAAAAVYPPGPDGSQGDPVAPAAAGCARVDGGRGHQRVQDDRGDGGGGADAQAGGLVRGTWSFFPFFCVYIGVCPLPGDEYSIVPVYQSFVLVIIEISQIDKTDNTETLPI